MTKPNKTARQLAELIAEGNCLGTGSGSSQSEGLDQGAGMLSERLQDVPALLFGG